MLQFKYYSELLVVMVGWYELHCTGGARATTNKERAGAECGGPYYCVPICAMVDPWSICLRSPKHVDTTISSMRTVDELMTDRRILFFFTESVWPSRAITYCLSLALWAGGCNYVCLTSRTKILKKHKIQSSRLFLYSSPFHHDTRDRWHFTSINTKRLTVCRMLCISECYHLHFAPHKFFSAGKWDKQQEKPAAGPPTHRRRLSP